MIVWHLLLAVDSIIHHGGWVLILAADVFLRMFPPHSHRMRRGKFSKWCIKTFGGFGDLPIRMPLAMAMLGGSLVTKGFFFVDIFYTLMAIAVVVDWVTGSDDPPWRKLKAAANKLLARIKPIPEPVVNV